MYLIVVKHLGTTITGLNTANIQGACCVLDNQNDDHFEAYNVNTDAWVSLNAVPAYSYEATAQKTRGMGLSSIGTKLYRAGGAYLTHPNGGYYRCQPCSTNFHCYDSQP